MDATVALKDKRSLRKGGKQYSSPGTKALRNCSYLALRNIARSFMNFLQFLNNWAVLCQAWYTTDYKSPAQFPKERRGLYCAKHGTPQITKAQPNSPRKGGNRILGFLYYYIGCAAAITSSVPASFSLLVSSLS
jgi:hypothetical protein